MCLDQVSDSHLRPCMHLDPVSATAVTHRSDWMQVQACGMLPGTTEDKGVGVSSLSAHRRGRGVDMQICWTRVLALTHKLRWTATAAQICACI